MRACGGQDKGQRAELAAFVDCLSGAGMPIPLETLVAEIKATFAAGENLSSGKSERV